jgi:predicted DNA-binding transcriptional regulator YafY
MEELLVRVESVFNLKGNNEVIVGFEQNPYLKGLHHFTELFNAIQYKKVLEIEYQGYKQTSPVRTILHPYYLKQYNSRWFLLGLNETYKGISNLALDRIIAIQETKTAYINNESINFDEYFEDVVGVSVIENAEPEKIILEVNKNLWSYIESKPLHGSQRIKVKTDSKVVIEITVQLNHELTALIFSYIDAIEVIEPQSLRDRFKSISETLHKKYF